MQTTDPTVPLKSVVRIKTSKLPEPFYSYWHGKSPLLRKWNFYLVDDKELYIEDLEYGDPEEEQLLIHWTQTNCCGVACFLIDLYKRGIKVNKDVPSLVRKNGEFIFSIRGHGYVLSAVSPLDGKDFTIIDG